jgi:hypothetical protein
MGKEIFNWVDGRDMSFEERMEEMYNNDMKTYFQKEYIEIQQEYLSLFMLKYVMLKKKLLMSINDYLERLI